MYMSVACLFLQVAKYRRNKSKVLKIFQIQVQEELNGRADGRVLTEILQQLLSSGVHREC